MISAFLQGAGADSLLLIVGDGPADYLAHCRGLTGGDPRIVFWGEEKNIDALYAATDYVVRGDPRPCVGRTVYEGLYSGCQVVMPGPGAPDLIFEPEKFLNAIHFYPPRDKNALAKVFADRAGLKVGQRQYRSNVEQYVGAFDTFADACVARHKKNI